MEETLKYGPILCTAGPHKGRIGYFDDTDFDCDLCKESCCSHNCNSDDFECDSCSQNSCKNDNCPEFAIVYWGDMLFCSTYQIIPIHYCTNIIPMRVLHSRIEILRNKVSKSKDGKGKTNLLQELEYAQTIFYEKHILSNFCNKGGKKVFISHSSEDKGFANCLYADLVEQGHNPWLDEWDIKGGQSIPNEIQKGLQNADYVVVILSPSSVKSNWVSVEWQTLLWDEINSKQTKVIPLLLESCTIPPLLKVKKYIDFREDYQLGLNYLLKSM